MFGSNPFGQSSSSPFGSQPVFGQTSSTTSNPFAPKPFGSSTSPFGSQTGGSIFGGMSTGVFGAQSSSPLGSTSVFGASSSPAFGSSTPTFGASTGSAFGNSSSAFGGTSVFGQKPTFGGFGSNTTPSSPFGGSFQQSQPAFGSNLFGSSTPFGAPSQPAFGASSSPAFGAPSTPAFGATSTPAFGSTASPTFGSTSGGFGVSSSPFGSSTPAFGASSTPAFGASSTPAFGATAAPAFGATSSPAFGATTSSAFGASSAPSFNFGSSPAFGQSTSAFGSSPFGATSSFGAQSTSFGAQTTTPAFGNSGFGQTAFGGQRGGSRVTPYSATPETDGATGTQPAGKLESISAMPVHKDKSHEELRWEDYQLGDKGGPAPAGQATAAVGFGGSGFGATSTTFSQSSANPFSSSTSTNPFAPKTPAFSSSGFGASTGSAFGSSPFAASNTANPFGSTSSTTSSLFGSAAQPFGANTSPSLFNSSSSSPFGSSIFAASTSQGTASTFGTGLGFGNTQSSPLFQSTTPTLAQTSSPFGQTSAFGQSASGYGQSNLFSTPSTGFGGNLFSSSSSLLSSTGALGFGQTTPSLSTPFQSAQSAPGGFNFSNFGQSQAAAPSGFGGTPGMFSNTAFGQVPGTQGTVAAQAAPMTNPFGTLPTMPQVSIGRTGTSPSVQYGISSLPVVEKPVPVRISSLLTSRHLSQRRIKLPVRKYHPKSNGPKVPFFNDDEETASTPKADAQFVPRENPRALVIRPLEQWHSRSSAEKPKTTGTPVHENGKLHQDGYNYINGNRTKDKDASPTEDLMENGMAKEQAKENQKANGVHDGLYTEKGDSYITLTGHRAGEAAIVYEHGAGIEALMPKLRHSDYYTEPRIQELAAKERAEPGYCRHVKDFIVGRHGYGSIKFFGETDVRRLDLESLIQFNNREVIVYMDESKKPPVGQGLNKPAEVTLLNIKCFDKKTGQQYTEGPRIDKYKEMLKRKAEDQGAEFVSYDPVKGEWTFRVNHFSVYKLGDDEEESHENVVTCCS
ncbi:nuclear pore complex protein NUP98A [Salvia miltiorrhiza]|uniref:nuclear pore complex protein NUP98A n=1 Tax=Salvia miltiorrhiza TaxID=226208 RepID=UPI0025AD50D8|nr:nuclear pore complex protein NUP98A [Salvia miltiorrhiza]